MKSFYTQSMAERGATAQQDNLKFWCHTNKQNSIKLRLLIVYFQKTSNQICTLFSELFFLSL